MYCVYTKTNRADLINGLSTTSLWQDLIDNGKIDGVDLSQDVKRDTNVWAMGSPTLEIFVDSWNTIYPDDKIFTEKSTEMSDTIGWGFYVGLNANPTSYYVSLSSIQGYNNPLYFPYKIEYRNSRGYWLSSPSAFYTNYVLNVFYSGNIVYSGFDANYASARPLIRLPSNILKKKVEPKVGDTIHYSPSGTYNWNAEYATSYETESSDYENANQTLSSNEGESFSITEWKVLNVHEETGKIDIVPASSATGTVTIHGAQGYNNGVYLLNEACNNLYSDSSKGITARSINIEDIEDAIKEAGNEDKIERPTQISGTYNLTYSKYPVIYSEEKLSTVNSSGTLDLSEQTRLIERNEGTSAASYIGAITSLNSMTRPYQTYYFIGYNSSNTLLGRKKSIILPNGDLTNYWIASRCVYAEDNDCFFHIRCVVIGNIGVYDNFFSRGIMGGFSYRIFPVVTVDSELLNAESENVFKVE